MNAKFGTYVISNQQQLFPKQSHELSLTIYFLISFRTLFAFLATISTDGVVTLRKFGEKRKEKNKFVIFPCLL